MSALYTITKALTKKGRDSLTTKDYALGGLDLGIDIVKDVLRQKEAEKQAEIARKEAAVQQAQQEREANLQIIAAQGEEQAASSNAQIRTILSKGKSRIQTKGLGGLAIRRRENQAAGLLSMSLEEERRRRGERISKAQARKQSAVERTGLAYGRIDKSLADDSFSTVNLVLEQAGKAVVDYALEESPMDELKEPEPEDQAGKS
ncbi:MAG: hypothetical protein AAGI11_17615 [Pseudomonadota bacterium]